MAKATRTINVTHLLSRAARNNSRNSSRVTQGLMTRREAPLKRTTKVKNRIEWRGMNAPGSSRNVGYGQIKAIYNTSSRNEVGASMSEKYRVTGIPEGESARNANTTHRDDYYVVDTAKHQHPVGLNRRGR